MSPRLSIRNHLYTGKAVCHVPLVWVCVIPLPFEMLPRKQYSHGLFGAAMQCASWLQSELLAKGRDHSDQVVRGVQIVRGVLKPAS